MTTLVTCPHCHETMDAPYQMEYYDWSGSKFPVIGFRTITCPDCEKDFFVEARAEVTHVRLCPENFTGEYDNKENKNAND